MKICQVLDDRHILVESDIVEVDNQGKEVYFLLNLDGSLPFPGIGLFYKPVAFSSLQNKSQCFRTMVHIENLRSNEDGKISVISYDPI